MVLRILRIFCSLPFLCLLGCNEVKAPASQMPPAPAVMVGTLKLAPSDINVVRVRSGRASPFAEADIRPQVTGIIEKRLFTEGQNIVAGQALYKINSSEYSANVSRSEAELKGSEADAESQRETVKRYKRLIDINAVSRQVYDEAVANLKIAESDIGANQAALQSDKINLARTIIKAPISGDIGRSSVTVGALVTSNQTNSLAKIVQTDPIYIDIAVSSTEVIQWRQDLAAGVVNSTPTGAVPVTVILDNGEPYSYIGELAFGEPTVDESTGTIIVRAVVPNPDRLLLPGMFLKTSFIVGTYKNAFLVPQKAVQRRPNGDAYLYLVTSENTAISRTVKIEGTQNGQWIVTDGVKAGEKIITSGLLQLKEGVTVQEQKT